MYLVNFYLGNGSLETFLFIFFPLFGFFFFGFEARFQAVLPGAGEKQPPGVPPPGRGEPSPVLARGWRAREEGEQGRSSGAPSPPGGIWGKFWRFGAETSPRRPLRSPQVEQGALLFRTSHWNSRGETRGRNPKTLFFLPPEPIFFGLKVFVFPPLPAHKFNRTFFFFPLRSCSRCALFFFPKDVCSKLLLIYRR